MLNTEQIEGMCSKEFNTVLKMKKILDACCGSRMFWFDREHKDVLFKYNIKKIDLR